MDTDVTDYLLSTTRAVRKRLDLDRPVERDVIPTIHLGLAERAAVLLDIPDDYTQVALFPVAYTIGTDFKPAQRPPVESIVHFDSW